MSVHRWVRGRLLSISIVERIRFAAYVGALSGGIVLVEYLVPGAPHNKRPNRAPHETVIMISTLEQCRLDLKFSELTRMPVYGKGMRRIGKVTDIEFGLKDRLMTELVVKVDGEDAKKAWKGRLHLRSPKISIPAGLVSGVKDAILLQCTLEEMISSVKKV